MRELRRVSIISSIVAFTFLNGCGAKEIPPRFYVASVTLSDAAAEPLPDENRGAVPQGARPGGSPRVSVAFVPPSWCAGEDGSSRNSIWELKACVSTVAALERRASEAGYRVVDWRLVMRNPTEAAVREHLDALFLIENIEMKKASSEDAAVSKIEYAEQVSGDKRVPAALENLKMVNARCDGAMRVRQRRRANSDELLALSLSLKMVSVKGGDAEWFYQHGVRREGEVSDDVQDYYYLSEGTKTTKRGKLAWGLTALAAGTAAVVAGVRLNEDGTSFATRNLGFGLAWASVLPFAVGLTLTTVGIVAEAKKPVYQPPDDVLCARPPFVENPLLLDASSTDGPPQPPLPPASDRMLMDRLADDFIESLQAKHSTTAARPPEVRPAVQPEAPSSARVEIETSTPAVPSFGGQTETRPASPPPPPEEASPPKPPAAKKENRIIIFNKSGDKRSERKGGGTDE